MSCLHQYSNNCRLLLREKRQYKSFFDFGHQCNSEASEKRHSEHEDVRSRSNMIPMYVISHNAPEILSSSDIWIWISDFFLLKNVAEIDVFPVDVIIPIPTHPPAKRTLNKSGKKQNLIIYVPKNLNCEVCRRERYESAMQKKS